MQAGEHSSDRPSNARSGDIVVPEIRHARVNGARLSYAVHAEASGRPSAIFVHGYSGRSTGEDGYAELLRLLAEEFTVYALDLRGHGASATEVEGWSMSTAADDVAAFARELGIVGAAYIGHSMGGFTGLYCEVRHPGTFSALCLVATASAEGGGHTPAEMGQALIEHGRDPAFLLGAVTPMYVRGGDASGHVRAAALVDPRVHELYFAEYPDRVIIDDIRSIHLPVLVLSGALDVVVPCQSQHATALALPNCKEVVATTEGHMMPLESPAFTAREIIGFLRHDVGTTFPLHDHTD